MGFSYQKARFVSDHKDPEKRMEWLEKTWPEIIKHAERKHAAILFGDEASFPQWGTLTYTWAKRGQQPTIKTSGVRKGYKVFGLIDYFTGRFFYRAREGRLQSESYAGFLQSVLEKTQEHIILIQDGARYHTSKAMQEIVGKIAEQHGLALDKAGARLRLEMEGFDRLVVERIADNQVYVAHHFDQNGDVVPDPAIVFFTGAGDWAPIEVVQVLGGRRVYARLTEDGKDVVVANPALDAMGKFKIDPLPIATLGKNTAEAQRIADRTGWR